MKKQLTLDEVTKAWASMRSVGTLRNSLVLWEIRMLRELAKGQPVSAERAAELTEEVTLKEVKQIFAVGQTRGNQFNSDGELIGSVLTLKPTQHHFRVNGNHLYAWCSFDTIFLPALLGKTAEVESTCPVTGETIRLTITPSGVNDYSPSSTVLSIILPNATPSCTPDQTGPDSAMCSRMHFFSSREAAETWLKNRPGVAILTVEESYQLAREAIIEPYYRKALESIDKDSA